MRLLPDLPRRVLTAMAVLVKAPQRRRRLGSRVDVKVGANGQHRSGNDDFARTRCSVKGSPIAWTR
jgi:hypothetical protein